LVGRGKKGREAEPTVWFKASFSFARSKIAETGWGPVNVGSSLVEEKGETKMGFSQIKRKDLKAKEGGIM